MGCFPVFPSLQQGEAPSHDDGRRLPASSENLSALPWREGDAEGGVIPNEGAGVARLEEAEVRLRGGIRVWGRGAVTLALTAASVHSPC